MRKPVSHWSNSDVVSWVEGLGQWAQTNLTQVFVNEVVNKNQVIIICFQSFTLYTCTMYICLHTCILYVLILTCSHTGHHRHSAIEVG